jgi:ribonuclease P protein component
VTDFSFGKRRRLLTPGDYQQVFQAAALKVSSKDVLILARSNAGDSARLGLVIAKKHVRRANQRNRIKRIIRETFRHQPQLAGLDIVVLARGGLDRHDNRELHQLLQQLWQQLLRKHQRRSAE